MNRTDGRLEDALARTEADLGTALKAAQGLVTQLKRAHKATTTGSIRDLARGLEQVTELAVEARAAIDTARGGWTFDIPGYLESGSYRREVLELAAQRGVQLHEQDDRIISFPSLVRVLPSDAAVEIDRKRRREIRPSALVEALEVLQNRTGRFRSEAFLEALVRAYGLVIAEQGKEAGDTVRLVDVHRVLTILPGQSAAYSLQEFGRDIYLLDESRTDVTRDGSRLELPAASGARSGQSLPTVTRTGEVKVYYGIAFR